MVEEFILDIDLIWGVRFHRPDLDDFWEEHLNNDCALDWLCVDKLSIRSRAQISDIVANNLRINNKSYELEERLPIIIAMLPKERLFRLFKYIGVIINRSLLVGTIDKHKLAIIKQVLGQEIFIFMFQSASLYGKFTPCYKVIPENKLEICLLATGQKVLTIAFGESSPLSLRRLQYKLPKQCVDFNNQNIEINNKQAKKLIINVMQEIEIKCLKKIKQ